MCKTDILSLIIDSWDINKLIFVTLATIVGASIFGATSAALYPNNTNN